MNDLTTLKAQAYDILAAIEQLNLQLQEVNKQIATIYQGEPKPEPEPEVIEG